MTSDTLGTALITGASTGIGAVYADRLARRGHDLILTARDTARMTALAARLREATGQRIDIVRADLTDAADRAVVETILRDDPTITVLINNAGMSLEGSILDNDGDQIARLIALNVTAPSVLAAAAAKAFVARGKGAIVNMSSVLALAPERFDGLYSGSKADLLNLSLAMASQLADKGVYVQAVLPGVTRTEIWARSGKDVDAFPAEIVMSVDDLVDAALVGFDRRETVTIPPLQDDRQWADLMQARLALAPHLSARDVAPRYRTAQPA
ncbi:SDR family NAD(P)-dependent oxidoreductase [Sphingomonas sp.]|uniref:SDR family NAD(P)-dependent oxidoreductase n=1 Tax=Sphingomonas sp. TaxID=28214 RepID=UPI003B3AEF23